MLALRKSMITNTSDETNHSIELSDKELGTLSHIGGYVLRNIYKKIKRSKNWHENNSQMAIALLDAARATGALDEQSFYGALNRANLWKITTDAENIFKIAEKYFRLKTNQKNLRNTDIEYIISSSLSDPETNSLLDQIIITVGGFVDREVAENLPSNIVTLYIRVRSFSKARYIMEKHNNNEERKGGLGKGLKKANN